MMQKLLGKLIVGVAISSLSVSVAFADAGHFVKVTLDCPDISEKSKDVITNYGTYIAGKGIERVERDALSYPLFQGTTIPGANIPIDLKANGYKSTGVHYNPADGSVTCYYKSTQGFDPFSLSYLMMNATGGYSISSDNEKIRIKLPVALV